MIIASRCRARAHLFFAQLRGWVTTGGQFAPSYCASLWSVISPRQRVLLNSDICLQISDSWYYLLLCTTVSFRFAIGRLLAKSLSRNTTFVLQHLCIMHCAGLRCIQMGCGEHIIWDSFTRGALQWRLLLEYILNVLNCWLVLNF